MTTHFAILFARGGTAQALIVAADEADHRQDGSLVLRRDDAVVYQAPPGAVSDAVGCDSQKAAADRCREHRESLAGAGAGTFSISEGGPAPTTGRLRGRSRGGGTAIPAEGISIKIQE